MLLPPGEHVVAGTDIYGGTYRLLHKVIDRSKIARLDSSDDRPGGRRGRHDAGDQDFVDRIARQSTDVDYRHRGLRDIAHRHGALLGVDNTFATPALTRPLDWAPTS